MRTLRTVLIGLGVTVLLLVIGLALFVAFGLDSLRGPIARAVTDSTGRELRIEGALRPTWSRGRPGFRVEGVQFANPEWASEPLMVKAQAIEASVSLAPLLRGRLVLPEVHLTRPEVALEIDKEGRKSWLLDRDPEPKRESRVSIANLTLDDGTLRYADAGRDTKVVANLASKGAGVTFAAKGRYNGLPAIVAGSGGPVLSLREDTEPYPLKADARIGATTISTDGTVVDLASLARIDMQIRLSGDSMDQLYKVVGVAFPSTKRWATAGRLIRQDDLVRYEKFTGTVGGSDLAGTLEFDTRGERPFMRGDLVSKTLDLADLGTVIGTGRGSKQQAGVLPDAPFDAKRWMSVDADVGLRTGTIKRPEQLPIENLSTRIRMKQALLTLEPLEFGIAGGKLAGTITLNGREPPIKADVKMQVKQLQLAKLMPTVEQNRLSVGAASGVIDLSGRGDTVAKMLGSASGKLGVYVENGQVSRAMMELAALDLWHYSLTKLKGDEPVPIRCVIADFSVKDGVAESNALVFDTSVVNVQGAGTVNLKDEGMSLVFEPKAKHGSLASLRSPLQVSGSFSDPKVSPDMGRITAKGAGALALGILNPLLAVLPLMNTGDGKDSNCAQLIAEARTRVASR
jgi:uncharacterized protein involved in outer membrane biogenesis